MEVTFDHISGPLTLSNVVSTVRSKMNVQLGKGAWSLCNIHFSQQKILIEHESPPPESSGKDRRSKKLAHEGPIEKTLCMAHLKIHRPTNWMDFPSRHEVDDKWRCWCSLCRDERNVVGLKQFGSQLDERFPEVFSSGGAIMSIMGKDTGKPLFKVEVEYVEYDMVVPEYARMPVTSSSRVSRLVKVI
eukprot:TRINITY_DN3178_c0_g1_i2.p1 TRINITY_DN3178_c0_g1~~TRINITY_DN3178_c0_g1_i2.p1  ORF type:complete len:188 (+),score=31.14 TRINITY_DN3178_c0_g1_i2:36-599(+)